MCSPTLGLQIAYVGFQAVSGIYQARAQAAQGEAEANYRNAVAKQQEEQARLTRQIGQKQAEVTQDVAKSQGTQLAQSQARERASQTAAATASGVYGGVTLDDIARDTSNVHRADELALRYNADVRAWESTVGAENRAYGLESNASQQRMAAENAKAAGRSRGFSTLLGTAVSVASPFAFKPFAPKIRVAPGVGAGLY